MGSEEERPVIERENRQEAGQGEKAGVWMHSHGILVQGGMLKGWHERVKEIRQLVGQEGL